MKVVMWCALILSAYSSAAFGELVCSELMVAQLNKPTAGDSVLTTAEEVPVLYESQVLIEAVEESSKNFGSGLSLDGETLAIGKNGTGDGVYASVELYEFRDGLWTFAKQLRPPEQQLNDAFHTTALNGDTLAVGAENYCANGGGCRSGAAYIFERDRGGNSNWGFVKMLVGGNKADSIFGVHVTIDEDTLVVSAMLESDGDLGQTGAVYIYQRDHGGTGQWGLVKRLEEDQIQTRDFFGSEVSIKDDTIIVIGDERTNVFEFGRDESGQDNWGLVQKFSVPQFRFGAHAFDGSTLVLTARNDCIPSEEATYHLMFVERNQDGVWSLQQDIDTNQDIKHLAIEGNRLLVKSKNDTVGYLYKKRGASGIWGLAARFATSENNGAHFYSTVALDSGRAILANISGQGIVFAYNIAEPMNAGLNDAWYNPDTDGQGFFITVFPYLGYVSLAWFTYDTEPPPGDAIAHLGDAGHRWITALGPYVGNQAVLNIDVTSNGIFDTATEISHTDPAGSDGTITLTFENCNSGIVEYDIPSINRQGTVPIRRVAGDNIALCQILNEDLQNSQ